ncbi:60S acidic ribosomal protein P1 [Citrus sinensis]|uniref:60S acidic ribosomal protein P1 n=1 Tax=Citrus sinensis TaxID=2711 RepID=A0ACB8I565_CITSI|nr:60S acidic ribosomal protein P1 [Citrus sinensis]
MSIGELACTYASDVILFSKLFEKRSADELYLNVGSGNPFSGWTVATPAVASGGLGGAALAAAVEEKKEETKEESDDDMGLSLFD